MKLKTKPIPVRMDQLLLARAEKVAYRIGTSRSAVVRLALLTQLPLLEAGVLTIPKEINHE